MFLSWTENYIWKLIQLSHKNRINMLITRNTVFVFPCRVLPETFWFLLPALVRWQLLVVCSKQGAALSSHILSSDSLKKKVSLRALDTKGVLFWRVARKGCFLQCFGQQQED